MTSQIVGGDVVDAGLHQLDLAQHHCGRVDFPQSHPDEVEHAHIGVAHKRLQPESEKLEEHQEDRQNDQAENDPGDRPDGPPRELRNDRTCVCIHC